MVGSFKVLLSIFKQLRSAGKIYIKLLTIYYKASFINHLLKASFESKKNFKKSHTIVSIFMHVQKYLQQNCRITQFKMLHFLLPTTTVLSVIGVMN